MTAVWIDADIQALITGIIKYLKWNTEKNWTKPEEKLPADYVKIATNRYFLERQLSNEHKTMKERNCLWKVNIRG